MGDPMLVVQYLKKNPNDESQFMVGRFLSDLLSAALPELQVPTAMLVRLQPKRPGIIAHHAQFLSPVVPSSVSDSLLFL